MIQGGVKNPVLVFCAAFDLDLSEDALPGSFSLSAHGVEVPVGNLSQEISACLLRTHKGDADLHLNCLIARSVEGYISADLSFIGGSRYILCDATISPCAEGTKWAVKLCGKMDRIGRLIP